MPWTEAILRGQKVLLLAWAYDRTYGFMDRIFNGPLQYREHRQRTDGTA